jgi:predicted lipoprotein with Yx(FWY)xxD motif
MRRLITLSTGAAAVAVSVAVLAPGAGAAYKTTTVSARHTSLGTVLVGPNGRTLYLFEKDKGGKSSCSGACASVWPPLTTSGTPKASGGVRSSLLGTTKRAGGVKQVTYKGHPLYYYVTDTKSGQTTGEGVKSFGAEWYVLATSGNKIDES